MTSLISRAFWIFMYTKTYLVHFFHLQLPLVNIFRRSTSGGAAVENYYHRLFHCMATPPFTRPLYCGRHWGCLHLGAMKDKVVNSVVREFWCTCVHLCLCTRVYLGAKLLSCIWKVTDFQKVCIRLYLLEQCLRVLLLYILTYTSHFNINHS